MYTVGKPNVSISTTCMVVVRSDHHALPLLDVQVGRKGHPFPHIVGKTSLDHPQDMCVACAEYTFAH